MQVLLRVDRGRLRAALLLLEKGMPLYYLPKQGDVLVCDFTRGFVPPEMVKVRKVVVISHRARHRRRLCTVVPISSTSPENEFDWHHLLRVNPLITDGAQQLWVKCDMIYTVSFDRLDKAHRKTRGGREYFVPRLCPNDLEAVINGVKSYLPL
jgi:uncharacterized protein YifN (PemK superfamily)